MADFYILVPFNHLCVPCKKENFTRVRKAESEMFLKKISQKTGAE